MSTWLTYASKAGKNTKSAESGDVVTVFDENKKRLEWRTAVIESLVKGKDDVVKGANIRVIAKEKSLRMSRLLKKLYPVEVRSETPSKVPRESAQEGREGPRISPRPAAAADAR